MLPALGKAELPGRVSGNRNETDRTYRDLNLVLEMVVRWLKYICTAEVYNHADIKQELVS